MPMPNAPVLTAERLLAAALKYMATARAGSTEYSQKSNAVGVVKVSNNVGTVLVNKSFTGSISQRYSRAINSAGRFGINVSVTNRNSLRYSLLPASSLLSRRRINCNTRTASWLN
jgi:hypothetical protein